MNITLANYDQDILAEMIAEAAIVRARMEAAAR